jgi:hypothetical protein
MFAYCQALRTASYSERGAQSWIVVLVLAVIHDFVHDLDMASGEY